MALRYLLALLAALLSTTVVWQLRSTEVPALEVHATHIDPLAIAVLDDYRRYRGASIANDIATMADIARTHSGFLGLRASFELARTPTLPVRQRLEHLERALARRIVDPLARSENRELMIELARLAEVAGHLERAIEAYEEALPLPEAKMGLERLQLDPYRLSNSYLNAHLYQEALDALGEQTSPSIEAPSFQALGEDEKALDAYERWLAEHPENLDARYGEAWSHFALGNLETARKLFLQLPGSKALYGRALVANRQGRLGEAVALLHRSGDPSHLWLATTLLETRNRHADAVPIYLELAEGDSRYADDAAYRALVLSRRQGLDTAAEASSLIPENSFFGLKVGASPSPPTLSTLPNLYPEVLNLTAALVDAGDLEAATGELLFALRETEDEATAVAIGEALQAHNEYRQSKRIAEGFISRGSNDLRTWRLAYPRAYPELVLPEARKRNLEPELVWAVMHKESSFYPLAVSVSNAQGLMQVIPSTWNWLAELQGEPPADPFNPAASIRYGSAYLDWLIDLFDGDLELVVASYSRGQGYIQRLFEGPDVQGDKDELYRHIVDLEGREYLQQVLVNFELYKALYR